MSKLGKVLKRINLLEESQIPDEALYQFRQRSAALTAQWAKLGGNDGTPVPTSVPVEVKPDEAYNGNGTTSTGGDDGVNSTEAGHANGSNGTPAVDSAPASATEA